MKINLNLFNRKKKPVKVSKKYKEIIEISKKDVAKAETVIKKRQNKIEKTKYSNVKDNMVIGKIKWYKKLALKVHLIKSKKELQFLKKQLNFEKGRFKIIESNLTNKIQKLLSNVDYKTTNNRKFEQLKKNVNAVKEIIDIIDQTIMKIDKKL
ncbi:MAG: hypothetical protein WCY27_01245 [archaeon]|jgi:hypothetical protein|nr:hypothetical protein [archaeon]MDD2477779.1 hypothetical protein [Candidatus ainarchaeum sp.]MDD3084904.1 hypothetical protein [Candidatus ainarchaeum sp.]MDD4221183.1 hypothetical protein [Candidatus ainarchaeum sp.]MDD4662865.1 hypothetical protein [Candidatus ainarchaeum sp.]